MKINTIYRLYYDSKDEYIEGDFYSTKEEALDTLDLMKEKVKILYENDDSYSEDSVIY